MIASEIGAWTQSEPPSGSGGVHAQVFDGSYGVPTRYREVVRTVSKHDARSLTVSKLGSKNREVGA